MLHLQTILIAPKCFIAPRMLILRLQRAMHFLCLEVTRQLSANTNITHWCMFLGMSWFAFLIISNTIFS